MRKFPALLVALVCVAVSSVSAQTADPQFRLLLHKQHVEPGRSIGIAGWVVIPNALAKGPAKGFAVGGILFKGEGCWTEVMAGKSITAEGGDSSNILDIRSFAKTPNGLLDAYAEAFYDLDARKVIAVLNSTVALSGARIGIEADTTFVDGKFKSTTGGPRIVLPFEAIKGKKSNFTLAYHHEIVGESTNFFRAYLLLNF